MPVEFLADTQSDYVPALTLGAMGGSGQQFSSVFFAISSPNSAKYQVAKKRSDGTVYWDTNDITAQPGQGGYSECYGIRFKSYDPSNPTTVLCVAYFVDDPLPLGNLASSIEFTTSGATSAGKTNSEVAHNGTVVGNEPTLDLEDALGITWSVNDDSVVQQIKVTPGRTVSDFTNILHATTTDPVLGNGAINLGQYSEFGGLVQYSGRIKFGTSGVSAGNGTYQIQLPVLARYPSGGTLELIVGTAFIYDNSTGTIYFCAPEIISSSNILRFRTSLSGGQIVTNAVPFGWSASDQLSFGVSYIAA